MKGREGKQGCEVEETLPLREAGGRRWRVEGGDLVPPFLKSSFYSSFFFFLCVCVRERDREDEGERETNPIEVAAEDGGDDD